MRQPRKNGTINRYRFPELSERVDTPDLGPLKNWEAWWWGEQNAQCKLCQRECKQSDKVDLLFCPRFIEILPGEDRGEKKSLQKTSVTHFGTGQ